MAFNQGFSEIPDPMKNVEQSAGDTNAASSILYQQVADLTPIPPVTVLPEAPRDERGLGFTGVTAPSTWPKPTYLPKDKNIDRETP